MYACHIYIYEDVPPLGGSHFVSFAFCPQFILAYTLYMLITASKINDLNSLVWQYGLFYIFFTRQRSHYWVTNFATYLLLLSTLPWLPTLDGKVDEQGENEHETRKPCQCLITILALLTLILVTFAALKSRVISNGCSGWSYASSMKHMNHLTLLQHQHTPNYATFDQCKLVTIHHKNCNRAESSIMKK